MIPLPKEVYGTFAGPIDQQAVQRFFYNFGLAVTNGVGRVHLLIQSNGGFVDDGISIYNYLANLPIEVISYNEGTVQSIAVLPYLAGKIRRCADNATFLLHKTTFNVPVDATAELLRGRAQAAESSDKRTDNILHASIQLSEEKWALRDKFGLTLSADEAAQAGLVHEIRHFTPPQGCQLFNI